MIEFIIGWILGIITLLGGMEVGRKRGYSHDKPDTTFNMQEYLNKKLTQVAKQEKKLGGFEGPTQADILLNENPQLKAEMKEMSKVFKKNEL